MQAGRVQEVRGLELAGALAARAAPWRGLFQEIVEPARAIVALAPLDDDGAPRDEQLVALGRLVLQPRADDAQARLVAGRRVRVVGGDLAAERQPRRHLQSQLVWIEAALGELAKRLKLHVLGREREVGG